MDEVVINAYMLLSLKTRQWNPHGENSVTMIVTMLELTMLSVENLSKHADLYKTVQA